MGFSSIIAPGRNCWRRCAASRLAVLVDAGAYHRAFVAAASKAEHSILIIGWDLHSNVRLGRSSSSEELGPFLNALARAKRSLDIHVVEWDFAQVFATGDAPHAHFEHRLHRRVHFELDDHHPPGASHHQKIVVIDDTVAFVGGLDLTARAEGAFHDVQVMVEGETARCLGDLARERWFRCTNKRLKPPHAGGAIWPEDVMADATDLQVAVARTEAAHDERPSVHEVERLWLDAIAAARQRIYIESQYLTSRTITEALGKRLKQHDGPEIVLVLPQQPGGWLEGRTMSVLRGRVLEDLKRADAHGRLGVFTPHAATAVNVHSKVLVVDDALARIGSSNVSNRSMGLDSECDIAWEDVNPSAEASIRGVRHRLLAAHLGCEPSVYAEAETKGGMLGAIRASSSGERRLEPLEVAEWEATEEAVPRERLVDPSSSIDVELVLETLAPADQGRSTRHAMVRLAVVIATLVGMAALWRWSPLHAYVDPRRLAELAEPLREEPWAWLVAIGAYALAGLMSFPLILLVLQSGLIFGAARGIPIAYAGAIISAGMTFSIGRFVGRGFVGKVTGRRLRAVMQRLRRAGVLSVIMVRLMPIAPFSIVNVVAGASGVRFSRFMIGTIVGMSPGIIGINLFGASLFDAMATRDPWRLVMSVGLGVLLVGLGFWIRRKLKKRGRLLAAAAEPAA